MRRDKAGDAANALFARSKLSTAATKLSWYKDTEVLRFEAKVPDYVADLLQKRHLSAIKILSQITQR